MIAVLAACLCQLVVADTPISIHDYTGRGFPPDLVTYRLSDQAPATAALRVYDSAGVCIPSQVWQVTKSERRLAFVASVAAGETATYTMKTSDAAPTVNLKIATDANGIEITTPQLAVRLPAETDKNFATPVAASTLQAPILGWRSGSGPWMGDGKILSERMVKRYTVAFIARGPVFAEVSYRIEWADGGYYRAIVQVVDGLPMARVTEEYDMEVLDGDQFWELDLAAGFSPDTIETASNHGNGGGDPNGRVVDLQGFTKAGAMQYLVGDQAWGRMSHIGAWRAADQEAKPGAWPLVGVVPIRKGLWRRSNAMEVHSDAAGSLTVRLPMGARLAVWPKDITSETSAFSTQEHEPGQSLTYGKRVWGLALGHPSILSDKPDRPCYQLRRIYGIVGLDRYKDFVLDWPDATTTYPRLYGTQADGDAAKALKGLRERAQYYFRAPESSHHGTAVNYLHAYAADAALANPATTADERREIRALVALITYMYEDADMMSYANGHHHGNPNMGTSRFWSGPTFMALLPDHPMFAKWRDHMAAYGRYNIACQMAPGGGYTEFGAAYHMHGYARTTHGIAGLMAAGVDMSDVVAHYHAPDWRYYMNLLTPYESRWRSRVIPGLANSPTGNTENILEAAGSLAKADPTLAAELKWAWAANGSNDRYSPLAHAADALAPVEPSLHSVQYPGVGVVFRAHQGEDETYMFLRAGFNWSHWYIDPGHFIMSSRGATLVPFQPYQYASLTDTTFDPYNTIRFGDPENQWPHGWGDSVVLETAFGPSTDYAWASTGFPDWFIDPGMNPTWINDANVTAAAARKLSDVAGQKQGAFTWDRQIMFMKGKTANSPNYFLFRDSISGGPGGEATGQLASYLSLNFLGTKENVAHDGSRFMIDTEFPTKLDIAFSRPQTPSYHEDSFLLAIYNSNITNRYEKDEPLSRDWQGVLRNNKAKERHVVMRLPAAPGEGYTWLLYPRKADEPAPTFASPASGVMIVTHPEGTDHVFMASSDFNYASGDIAFAGRSGAVRVSGDTVTLSLSAPGSISYRQVKLQAAGPAQKVFKIDAEEIVVVADPDAARGTIDSSDPAKTVFTAPAGVYVNLVHGTRGVRGIGPFVLTMTDDAITGTVSGDTRSIVVTWPAGITRPMFTMDGLRFHAGWADDHSIGKSDTSPQFSMAFGVTEGTHEIRIGEWIYPELPPQPAKRQLP